MFDDISLETPIQIQFFDAYLSKWTLRQPMNKKNVPTGIFIRTNIKEVQNQCLIKYKYEFFFLHFPRNQTEKERISFIKHKKRKKKVSY